MDLMRVHHKQNIQHKVRQFTKSKDVNGFDKALAETNNTQAHMTNGNRELKEIKILQINKGNSDNETYKI